MLINLRNAMMAGKRLPYDAEVEYLETTGNDCWFDTGITAENGLRFVGEIEYTRLTNDSGANTIFGGLITSPYIDGWLLNTEATKNWWQTRYGPNPHYFIGTTKPTVGTKYNIDCSLSSGNGWLKVDGNTLYTSNIIISHQAYLPIYVNRLYYVNGTNHLYASGGGYVKYYSMEFYDASGNLLRDFQPVRFTNELGQTEGAMYDHANPTVGMNPDGSARTDGLYLNRGTGAFLYGPDI